MIPSSASDPSRILVLATGNLGKVNEFRSLLAPGKFILLTPPEIGFSGDIPETGKTFAENALIKARALALHTPHPVLADDSGLEVEALNGAPGVFSARYAGSGASDAANRAKLLAGMKDVENRRARFLCVLCHLVPEREPVYFAGICPGTIANLESGQGGFGYDSVFIPEGHSLTFAELPQGEKDRLSHRAKAASLFLASVIE